MHRRQQAPFAPVTAGPATRHPTTSARPAQVRLWRTAAALVIAALAACGGEEAATTASRRSCEQLRDHSVELRLQSVTADRDQHKAALTERLAASFVDECLATASPAGVRCRLAAGTTDALAACRDE